MEFVVKQKPELLADGKYEGEITKVEYKTDPYDYTDIFVKPEGKDFELKYGCPSNVNEATKLGMLLANFTELVIDSNIDPEKVLVGKKVKFLTIVEKTPEGEFVKIVANSIKPLEE